MGKAVDGVVLCTSKPDHRLRERLPHRLRIGEAPGNDLSRKCDRQALGELQPLDRFGSDPRRQVDLRSCADDLGNLARATEPLVGGDESNAEPVGELDVERVGEPESVSPGPSATQQ